MKNKSSRRIRCWSILILLLCTSVSCSSLTQRLTQNRWQGSVDEIDRIFTECATKQLSDEKTKWVDIVRCGNDGAQRVLTGSKSRYTDLVAVALTQRLEIARQMDAGTMSEEAGQSRLEEINSYIHALPGSFISLLDAAPPSPTPNSPDREDNDRLESNEGTQVIPNWATPKRLTCVSGQADVAYRSSIPLPVCSPGAVGGTVELANIMVRGAFSHTPLTILVVTLFLMPSALRGRGRMDSARCGDLEHTLGAYCPPNCASHQPQLRHHGHEQHGATSYSELRCTCPLSPSPALFNFADARFLLPQLILFEISLVTKAYPHRQIWIDQYSGAVLAINDLHRYTAGQKFVEWQYPLHSGEAFGLPGRILVLLSGLVCPVLYGTGIFLWWRRRRATTRHARQMVKFAPKKT